MKVKLLVIGKTEEAYLESGQDKYIARLKRYTPFEYVELKSPAGIKNLSIEEQKKKEGALILANLSTSDHLIVLDEKGKQFTSTKMAEFISTLMQRGVKTVVFLVGGPFGFSKEVYERAHDKMALSELTFSHQMVRLFFLEQLYRSFTIIKGEKYHH